MAYLSLACRTIVALVFIASVVAKVRSRAQYADFVAATRRIAPGWLARSVPAGVLAGGVIVAETGVAAALLVPMTVPLGFALAGVLAMGFGGAVLAALRRGVHGSCNCFGASTRSLDAGLLVRNLLLTAIAGLGLAAVHIGGGSVQPAGAVVALAAGGIVAVLFMTADDIVVLFRPVAVRDLTKVR